MKKNLIKDIKAILNDWGGFSVGEVEADCSPHIESTGNLPHLAEGFYDKVTVNVYGNEGEEVDQYEVDYEELEVKVLKSILHLCILWQKNNQELLNKTMSTEFKPGDKESNEINEESLVWLGFKNPNHEKYFFLDINDSFYVYVTMVEEIEIGLSTNNYEGEVSLPLNNIKSPEDLKLLIDTLKKLT